MDGKFWQAMWKMRVPNKIKVFAWHCGQDSLPTSRNLAKKSIIENAEYPLCKQQQEDLFHVIFECPNVARIGQHDPLSFNNQTPSTNPLDLLQFCMCKCWAIILVKIKYTIQAYN